MESGKTSGGAIFLVRILELNTSLPARKASYSPHTADTASPLAANQRSSPMDEAPASPEEGAELIRAFLRIEQKSVRSAIVDLVARLSALSPPTERR
jgi:hypothetical protein